MVSGTRVAASPINYVLQDVQGSTRAVMSGASVVARDELVQKVFGASWYMSRGDVGNGMMLTAKQNPYEKYMPGGINDSNGFKQALTQYGQAGDVYRHILFFAGGTLSRLQPALWQAERTDKKQAAAGRKESIAELAGDRAGRHVGSLMDQAFDKKFDRNGLKDILRKELCK